MSNRRKAWWNRRRRRRHLNTILRGSLDRLPDDIVEEILLKLHIKPLFQFKCVSKRFNYIICNPVFVHTYVQRAQSSPEPLTPWPLWGMHHQLAVWRYNRFETKKYYQYKASSNGLVLSHFPRQHADNDIFQIDDLIVWNPLTNQSVKLPALSFSNHNTSLSFASRVTGGQAARYVTYKVVLIRKGRRFLGRYDPENITMTTFSSDTGRWTCEKLDMSCPAIVFYRRGAAGSTGKGVLYWFDWYTAWSVVTYDPFGRHGGFRRIQLPGLSGKMVEESSVKLLQVGDEDSLRYANIERCNGAERRLHIWRLVDYDKGEWWLERSCMISTFWDGIPLQSCFELVVVATPTTTQTEAHPHLGLRGCIFSCGKARVVDLMSDAKDFKSPLIPQHHYYQFDDDDDDDDDDYDIDYLTKHVSVGSCPWSSPYYYYAYRRPHAWTTLFSWTTSGAAFFCISLSFLIRLIYLFQFFYG